MNTRRERFCYEYAASGNATKAAEAAGYSPRTARSQGQRLLTNDDIKARLLEISKEIEIEQIASIQNIQIFWTETMNDGSQKTADRLKASELLMRSKGGFTQPISLASDEQDDVIIYVPGNGLNEARESDAE